MSLQDYLIDIGYFINDVLIPLLFTLALFFFLFNVARYFIIGGNDAKSRESAKQLALYGIGGFVILVSIWGIVNVLVYSLDIWDNEAPTPDYIDENTNYPY